MLSQYEADSGLDYWVVSSEADNILDTMKEVFSTLVTGVILTMIVLYLFLGISRPA